MRLIRQLAILAALFVFLFAFAQPVSAIKPETFSFPFDETFPFEFCDGFDVIHHHEGEVRVTTFFDNEGTPIRVQIKVLETLGTYTHSVTGETIDGPVTPVVVRIDLETGDTAVIGRPIHVTLPGQGSVIQDTGIVIFDSGGSIVFEGGPHGFLAGEDSFCDLFE